MSESNQAAHPVPKQALAAWKKVHGFALGLPGAFEDHPWGRTVVKVNKKVFVFLGVTDGSHPLGVTVKLTDEALHAHAMTMPGAEPAGYGLGNSGWVRLPLAVDGAPRSDLLCDWVEESFRAVAPKKLIGELDSR
ncbi:MmcQ/YjbR family DNA-binding protein [Streptomyces triticagri]|uniref:MmcQ/YjbR family DNA-binding protein n=1 Tax=Streptomyces triticagri TaxID=2293568 RepID=A0A372M997_9ACTN|nr:MmcQ/YjbR family DNA-binding protein [Streptomyces triticagri]RFU87200.1 MmcQ/YjbR family DNA-binding protein [Streptomyces triticagri]